MVIKIKRYCISLIIGTSILIFLLILMRNTYYKKREHNKSYKIIQVNKNIKRNTDKDKDKKEEFTDTDDFESEKEETI